VDVAPDLVVNPRDAKFRSAIHRGQHITRSDQQSTSEFLAGKRQAKREKQVMNWYATASMSPLEKTARIPSTVHNHDFERFMRYMGFSPIPSAAADGV
jgi:hypothetical protein